MVLDTDIWRNMAERLQIERIWSLADIKRIGQRIKIEDGGEQIDTGLIIHTSESLINPTHQLQ